MPLFTSFTPSLPVRSFRSLVFDESLEIILESEKQVKPALACDTALIGTVNNLELENLKIFLKAAQKGVKGRVQVNPCLVIDLEKRRMNVKGYELQSFAGGRVFICSSNAPWLAIDYEFSDKNVITALEYLYHWATCA